ncbi:MAG TPA: NAD-dependent epimerase/dehydratase family protein [Myxococcota bacterium]|nr:NAD-dependent epimerase/dehydratase family protein [Myxococcota bacterium]HRY96540.1 NAD-dependent epimerase/dehydratase family protein [Myxococcota bacterium]
MRALVTGGGGFIGSALVRALCVRGHAVRSMDLVDGGRGRLAGLPVEHVVGSLRDERALAGAVRGVEVVFHLAALASDWGPRERFFEVNAEGTRRALEAARAAGARRFVHMSTLAVHRFTGHVGADEGVPADEDDFPYGASKAEAERHVRAAAARGGLEATIIRPGLTIFGPGDTTAFARMAPLLSRGLWVHVDGGRPLLCYSYVENLVAGLILAAGSPAAAGQTLILTDDVRLSWRELLGAVMRAFGARDRSLSVPGALLRASGEALERTFLRLGVRSAPPVTRYRAALVSRNCHFSCAKAKSVLGYRPEISFEEGIGRTVEWYRGWKQR